MRAHHHDPLQAHLDRSRDELARTPVGLYLHVPFCSRRCGYCAFATSTLPEHRRRSVGARYLAAARTELHLLARDLSGAVPALSSIYLGGGTPTVLDADVLVALVRTARDLFPLAPGTEVSVEANPDDVGPEVLEPLAAAGVTRMSVGLQSAATSVLDVLGRTHDPAEVPALVAAIRGAGIEHVNVDLILGTPGETPADWRSSIALARACDVDHVSCYALSVEPGTPLAARVRSGRVAPPDPDLAAERYRVAEAELSAAGFEWYELSNWARGIAAASVHNLLCWRNHNWIGVGPGAHSHLSGLRWWNHRDVRGWADDLGGGRRPWEGHESLDGPSRELESTMLGIRLREGVPVEALDPCGVQQVTSAGWAEVRTGRLVLTLEGRLLADAVLRRLCTPAPGTRRRPDRAQKSVRSSS